MPDLEQLRESVEKFAAERDWDQFHTPKNLSMALAFGAAAFAAIAAGRSARSRTLSA